MSITPLPEPVIKYFPYSSVRPYQGRFIKTIYDCVNARSHLVMEGANGLGKTIAVLSAALPIAKERGLGILYCARTHKQMDRVMEELGAISQKVGVSGLSIRGRLETCFHPLITRHASDAQAAMEICDQLKQRDLCPFYENLDRKAERCGEIQLAFESKPFTATEILEICKREEFCPYELAKLCLGQVDVVALSYIYALDPIIRRSFFKYLNKPLNEFILILDEAHHHPPEVGEFLLDWLTTSTDPAFAHVMVKYEAKSGGASAKLEIVSLEPRKIIEPIISAVYCTVNISGTLEPLEYFVKITGLPDSTYCEAVPSPFPEEHVLPLACVGVTTSLNERTPKMYRKIAKKIAEIVRYTPANVGVFTASFDVLDGLIDADLEAVINKPLLREQRGMSSRENDRLVSRFRSYAERGGAVLLGVEGGRSSEGADFPGKQLESVAIVGVPYMEPTPRVMPRFNIMKTSSQGMDMSTVT